MGRPINKKYFGNLVAPYDDAQTGGPTGQGGGSTVGTVTVTSTGSGYTTLPGLTFSAPQVVGGVTATGTATSLKAVSAPVAAAGVPEIGDAFQIGEVLTLTGGTKTSTATFLVGTIVTKNYFLQAGGTNYESGDTVTFSGTNWVRGLIVEVTALNTATGEIAGYNVTQEGIRDANAPANPVVATTSSGTGTNAAFNLGWGLGSVTVQNGGAYSVIPANPAGFSAAVTTITSATLTVSYGVGTVSVLNSGTGYTAAPTVAPSAGNATFGATLASSTGVGLYVTAYVAGTAGADGADIMKQEASRRYLVRNSLGTGQCKLVAKANGDLLAGEMNLVATDSLNSTYYVTKLTSRRATLTRAADGGGGYEYATGAVSRWTIGSATTGTVSLASV